MSISLLSTKLHIPPARSGLVLRSRLIDRMNEGVKGNLTLVSAPAGFGKTTLLGGWVGKLGKPVAWLSLEKEDNDPGRFWTYFQAAIRTIHPGLGKKLLELQFAAPQSPFDPFLIPLINAIETLRDPLVLILDDYHVIDSSPIQEGMIFLLDHLPAQLHLVVASRMDPPWPLARWRVRSELTELRVKDLRFSPEEAATFLTDIMGLKLNAREISVLEQRTEGWIAGLQMAALSMQGRGDIAGFLEGFTGSHRFVLDYLIEEVLSQQKPGILNFLLKTSILKHLTTPLCDAVIEDMDSQTMLLQLERSNMFLVSLDDERRWYRYHPLFADMLQARLKQIHPETLPALHRRASEWLAENGYLSEALTHAIAAGDLERLAQLVEKYAFTILDSNEASTFLNWLNTLPRNGTGSYPWLNIARAWLMIYLGRTDGIEQVILEAEKQSDSTDHRLQGYMAALRTLSAELYTGSFDGIDHAQKAFALLPQDEYRPRAFVSYHLGNLLGWRGDILPAQKALEDAAAWSLSAGDIEMAMTAQFERASGLRMQGRLRESLRVFEQTFQMADLSSSDRKSSSLSVGYAYLQMSMLYLEWNDLPEALRHAMQGIKICRSWGYSDFLYNGLGTLSSVLYANGDLDGALNAIREAKQVFVEIQADMYRDRMSWLEATINVARGDLKSASIWAARSGLSPDDTPDFARRNEYIHFAVILTAQGKLEEACKILERLQKVMEAAGAGTLLLEILAQQVIILHAMKEDEKAFSLLRHALELAEPEGHVRVFISKGAPMEQMLHRAAKVGITPNFVSRLLENYQKTSNKNPTAAEFPDPRNLEKRSAFPLIEPLSKRELEILRLLESSLSTPEIARELYLSVGTVRTHIKHIYRKLDVNRRMDAAQRARDMGLI